MEDTYLVIEEKAEALYKDKGSKFLAYAIPVNEVADVKNILNQFRKNTQYKGACHFCSAYKIGINGEHQKANDDGEPGGTAGRPILGQIESSGITNILIVVVRFFGGVLLGTGGLTHAYKTAAAMALQQCKVIEKIKVSLYTLTFNYEFQNEAEQLLHLYKLEPVEKRFNENIEFVVTVRNSIKDDFIAHATQFHHIKTEAIA